MNRNTAPRILLLLPAVLTEREREEHLAREREAHPDGTLVPWAEDEHPGAAWRIALRLRRERFDRVIIARGHEPLGYSRAKLVALLVGAPAEFEGRTWARADWIRNLLAITFHHARLRALGALMAALDRVLAARSDWRSRWVEARFLRRCRGDALPPCCPACAEIGLRRVPRFPGIAYLRCSQCGLLVASRWQGRGMASAECGVQDGVDARDARLRAPASWPDAMDGGCDAALRRPAELFVYLKECERLADRGPGRLVCVTGAEDGPAREAYLAVARRAGWDARCLRLAAVPAGAEAGSAPADLVVALDVAHRVPDPARLLVGLRALCSPDGLLLLRLLDWSFAERRRPVTSPLAWPVVFSRPAFDRLCLDARLEAIHTDSVVVEGRQEVWLRART